jgi:holliday junction DNA helicase RuvA
VIGTLSGSVAARSADGCLLEVAGVGYRVACSAATLAALPPAGGACRLWTHLQVRDDALALYGFATEAELGMFTSLLAVNGIGPRVALALCSAFTSDSFRRALLGDDAAAFASVPGVGRKTAQRIIIELKDRLAVPGSSPGEASESLARARSALENLGYSQPEVTAALGEAAPEPDEPVEAIVRSALKVLA